ncbi:MAG: hypothetical protein KDD63_10220, partial [Bacteroidetes bacterium]|nr:hypothetical protein [Bacteroidota bacterium]
MTPVKIWISGISFICLLIWLQGCGEDYINEPPFEVKKDTVFLDVDDWYYFSQQPNKMGGLSVYPFSYQIFETAFDGFLVNAESKIYSIGIDETLDNKAVFLDVNKMPGDTLHKFSAFRYHLLIDVKRDEKTQGTIYYVLRRSKIGVKRLRERSIWVISPEMGILGVANYNIGYTDGQVTLDIIGDPDYFKEPELIRKIKYYDHDVTWLVDRDRHIIYEFNKHKALLSSRDFKAQEDLYEYKFDKANTLGLIDFRIKMENNMIKLVAGDSCFFFTESLELQRSASCPDEY